LHRRGYDLIEKSKKSREPDEDVESFDDEISDAKLAKGYDYLLRMTIWNFTMEKVLQLQQELDEKKLEKLMN
jgi:DNA topoisomerase-2